MFRVVCGSVTGLVVTPPPGPTPLGLQKSAVPHKVGGWTQARDRHRQRKKQGTKVSMVPESGFPGVVGRTQAKVGHEGGEVKSFQCAAIVLHVAIYSKKQVIDHSFVWRPRACMGPGPVFLGVHALVDIQDTPRPTRLSCVAVAKTGTNSSGQTNFTMNRAMEL